jgi:hypothetical protein
MLRYYIACFSCPPPLLSPDPESIAVVLRFPAAYQSAILLVFEPPDPSKTELLRGHS